MSGRSRSYPLHEWLPRLDVHEPVEEAPAPRPLHHPADDRPAHDAAATPTVLVAGIDGSATVDPTLSLLLHAGYRTLAAGGAEEAVEVFVREGAQLVIVDEAIVASEGSELVRRLRSSCPALPILLRGDSIPATRRRELVRALELNGSYGHGDDPERVADLVDGALALTRSLDRLRTEQEVRGLILAKLCHNLRSPLHVIQGYTEMLREDAETSEVEELLARLAGATETALGLIHDYLDLARVDSPGVCAVQREKVELDQLMLDVLGFAGKEIGEQPLRLMTTIPFAGGSLYTDGEKLREILRQLVANAIKFTPQGEIRLTVRSGAAATDFVLEDPGVGITQRDAAVLFVPFRQRAEQDVAHVPGQGVGLAIAQRLSTLIGASLTAQQRERGGSIFTLRIPAPLIAQSDGQAPTLH
jgi:signal transduction histidine kinase